MMSSSLIYTYSGTALAKREWRLSDIPARHVWLTSLQNYDRTHDVFRDGDCEFLRIEQC